MGMAATSVTGLQVVSRNEWGARAPRSQSRMSSPVSMVFIHHTATSTCYSLSECSLAVKGIQKYHMDKNGWDDIGYSFLVGEDGRVYEGRGWGIEGAHTKGYNNKGIAFSFIGNFMSRTPNDAAIGAARDLISYGQRMGHLSLPEIFGHRDGGRTSCPGDILYQKIKSWPGYSDRRIPKF